MYSLLLVVLGIFFFILRVQFHNDDGVIMVTIVMLWILSIRPLCCVISPVYTAYAAVTPFS